jgi:exoribonuclease R
MEIKPCILDTRQTFGKDKKNKKFLYRCFPDDRSSPILVPFEIPPQFQKKRLAYYVLVEYTLPVGKLMDNLGEVSDPEHYYDYLLHCKKLHVSHRAFHHAVLRQLPRAEWDLPFRDARVFTIDGPNSIDLDDGFSVDSEKVSIYITCVPYVLEKLNLWAHLTDRISSIYFPSKRYPLLPGLLSTLCSLSEGTLRPCLALDLYHDGRIDWTMCTVKIHRNYTYENVSGQDYQALLTRSNTEESSSMVHHYMTRYNTLAGAKLQKGIYLKVHAPESLPPDWLPAYSRHYSTYELEGDYAQLTSPIRRLVDIINMTQLTSQIGFVYSY